MTNPDTLYAVYTAGKAATTTTHRTLAKHLSTRIYDVRRATTEGVAEFRAFAREHLESVPLRTDDDEFSQLVAQYPDVKLRLVTLTREPVAAAISSWFFNFNLRHPTEDPNEWSTSQHIGGILEGGYASREDFFTEWFNFECAPFTGIDVLAHPFPIEQGYTILTSERVDLLVIRSEDLNRVYQEAFREFLSIEVRALEEHHIGERSDYAAAYTRFKAEAALPEPFINAQHESRYATTFYSPEELMSSRRTWMRLVSQT